MEKNAMGELPTTTPDEGTAGGECCGGGACETDVRDSVRDHYAALVRQRGDDQACCAPSPVASQAGYTAEQLAGVPPEMRETTFACGNPVAFAEVQPGQVVLDIGSGAGLDLILAAQAVGPTGTVIGLDMTREMVEKATSNVRNAGIANVEVRQGFMEKMPIDDASVDWVISNCVINLSPDKPLVFSEIMRVLKPGGRMLVSDIVTHGLPEKMRKNAAAYASCIGGALEEEEYLAAIRAAGFEDVEVTGKMTYSAESIAELIKACCSDEVAGKEEALQSRAELDGKASSVRVSARKPAASCCG